MSRHSPDTWDAVFGVFVIVGFAVAGAGLFLGLAAHPNIAAAWALISTAGTVWLGALYAERRHADRLRALADADRERLAVRSADERRTVADVIIEHRLGRRIGDAERDVTVGALHVHFAAGRLDAAELDERLAAALAAKTVDDLIHIMRDLPSEETGR